LSFLCKNYKFTWFLSCVHLFLFISSIRTSIRIRRIPEAPPMTTLTWSINKFRPATFRINNLKPVTQEVIERSPIQAHNMI
jgi:hypothetical protein